EDRGDRAREPGISWAVVRGPGRPANPDPGPVGGREAAAAGRAAGDRPPAGARERVRGNGPRNAGGDAGAGDGESAGGLCTDGEAPGAVGALPRTLIKQSARRSQPPDNSGNSPTHATVHCGLMMIQGVPWLSQQPSEALDHADSVATEERRPWS